MRRAALLPSVTWHSHGTGLAWLIASSAVHLKLKRDLLQEVLVPRAQSPEYVAELALEETLITATRDARNKRRNKDGVQPVGDRFELYTTRVRTAVKTRRKQTEKRERINTPLKQQQQDVSCAHSLRRGAFLHR